MKIEININKKYAIIIGLILLTGIIVYAQVDTSQPYHSASQIQFSDGTTLEDMRTFTPGDIMVAASDSEVAKSCPDSWCRVKNFVVGQGGEITVFYQLKSGWDDRDVYARIYVNGEAKSSVRSRDKDSYQSYMETIGGLEPGDVVQLYVKGGGKKPITGINWYVYTKNFRIFVGNKIPSITSVEL